MPLPPSAQFSFTSHNQQRETNHTSPPSHSYSSQSAPYPDTQYPSIGPVPSSAGSETQLPSQSPQHPYHHQLQSNGQFQPHNKNLVDNQHQQLNYYGGQDNYMGSSHPQQSAQNIVGQDHYGEGYIAIEDERGGDPLNFMSSP